MQRTRLIQLLLVVFVVALAGCSTRPELNEEDREKKAKLVRLLNAYHASKLSARPPLRDQILAVGGQGERLLYGYLIAIFRHQRRVVSDVLLSWARDEFVTVMGKTKNRGFIVLLGTLRTGDTVARLWATRVLERCRDGVVHVAEEGQEPEDVPGHLLIRRIYDDAREKGASPEYCMALLRAIAAMRASQDDLGLQAFYEELAGPEWEPRGRLLGTVGYLNSQESKDLLAHGLEDPQQIIRQLAARTARLQAKRIRARKRKVGQ